MPNKRIITQQMARLSAQQMAKVNVLRPFDPRHPPAPGPSSPPEQSSPPPPPSEPLPPPSPTPTAPYEILSYAVVGWGYSLTGGLASGQRAQVALYRQDGDAVASAAWLRFFDEGAKIPADFAENGIIRIHAPMSALAGVLNILGQPSGEVSVQFNGGFAQLDYNAMESDLSDPGGAPDPNPPVQPQ
jgi:hypothetical protein